MNLQSDTSMLDKKLEFRAAIETNINDKLKALRENQEKIVRNEKTYYDAEKNQQDINQY